MKSTTPRKIICAVVPVLAVAVAVSGCSGSAAPNSTPSVDPNAKVTITVSNQPPETQAADLAAYKKVITDFEKEYPNITVNGVETGWDPQTFQAQLAGGQLPTIMGVPFTEPQGLIARKQVANITSELDEVGLKDKLNPAAISVAEDKDGNIYGVPADAYALGLGYNRKIFEEAGLDPDNPPTTWEDVRKDAKIIADKTGKTGYAQMTTAGQGGWMLTAMTYSAGGTVLNEDGSEVTFTNKPQAMQEQLELLQKMRWTDNSMGSNFTYDQNGILKDFAAGKIGMVITAPVGYALSTQLFGMNGEDFGLGSMPQGTEAGGSLSGGGLLTVMPNATPAQRLAAVKFLAFRLKMYTDKDSAISAAKAANAAGQPVGLPGLSILKTSDQNKYLGWIKDYINVPLSNFDPYMKTIDTIKLQPEPAKDAQEIYSTLDSVVQAVLTKQDTDIPSTLDSAKSTVEGMLSR